MKKIIILIYYLVILCLINFSSSFAAEDGGLSGTFLRTGVGPRAFALGKAFTAVADDSTALYWNPAGLVNLKRNEVHFSNLGKAEYTNDMFFTYNAGMFNTSRLAIGWHRRYSGGYGVYEFDFNTYDLVKVREMQIVEQTFYLSYGLATVPGIYSGVSIKLFNSAIDTYSTTGLSFDVGMLVNNIPILPFPGGKLRIGIVIHDLVATPLKYREVTETVPSSSRIGIAYIYRNWLILSVDGEKTYPGNLGKLFAGSEVKLLNLISLRAGINSTGTTMGIGIDTTGLNFDYTFEFTNLGGLHHLGISYRFGKYVRTEPTSPLPRSIKEKEIVSNVADKPVLVEKIKEEPPLGKYILFYSTQSSLLDTSNLRILEQVVTKLKSVPGTDKYKVLIYGHSGKTELPTTEEQVKLSVQRILSVYTYLVVENNIPPENISFTAYGSSQPLVSDDVAEQQHLNARVEIQLIRQ